MTPTSAIQNTSVVFHTPTIIDPRSWELMGVSAKQGENPIGFFGTGLKYSLAVLLRTGHDVQIHTPDNCYKFDLTDIQFRDQDFQQVRCNGKELAFTTHYGANWKVWGAYRELVSNTMDEGGLHFAGKGPQPDGTSIVVTGPEILECLQKHSDYFLHDREPIIRAGDVSFYSGNGTVWYRGVRVGTLQRAHYSFEIHNTLELTEDRTIGNNYTVRYRIGYAVCGALEDKELIEQIITTEGFESELDYDNPWSETFHAVVLDVYRRKPTKLAKSLVTLIKDRTPDAGWEEQEITEDEQAMIDRAKEFLALAGYPADLQIRKVRNEDSNNLAFHQDQITYLTQQALDGSVLDLTCIIFEERSHRDGHQDYSRGFQNYLIRELMISKKKQLKFAL